MNSFLVIFVEIEREIRYQMTKASSLLLLCQWKEKKEDQPSNESYLKTGYYYYVQVYAMVSYFVTFFNIAVTNELFP